MPSADNGTRSQVNFWQAARTSMEVWQIAFLFVTTPVAPCRKRNGMKLSKLSMSENKFRVMCGEATANRPFDRVNVVSQDIV